jgi:hypothetical protein
MQVLQLFLRRVLPEQHKHQKVLSPDFVHIQDLPKRFLQIEIFLTLKAPEKFYQVSQGLAHAEEIFEKAHQPIILVLSKQFHDFYQDNFFH